MIALHIRITFLPDGLSPLVKGGEKEDFIGGQAWQYQ
jgi:hypothetical protein